MRCRRSRLRRDPFLGAGRRADQPSGFGAALGAGRRADQPAALSGFGCQRCQARTNLLPFNVVQSSAVLSAGDRPQGSTRPSCGFCRTRTRRPRPSTRSNRGPALRIAAHAPAHCDPRRVDLILDAKSARPPTAAPDTIQPAAQPQSYRTRTRRPQPSARSSRPRPSARSSRRRCFVAIHFSALSSAGAAALANLGEWQRGACSPVTRSDRR